jgi:hypothetical protein
MLIMEEGRSARNLIFTDRYYRAYSFDNKVVMLPRGVTMDLSKIKAIISSL